MNKKLSATLFSGLTALLCLCNITLSAQAGDLSSYSAPANIGGAVNGTYTDIDGMTYDGSGYTVVVIDGAFMPKAPQLMRIGTQSKVIAERCFGQGTGTTWTSLCHAGELTDRNIYPEAARTGGFYRATNIGSSEPSNSSLGSCADATSNGDAPDYFCHNYHGTATSSLVAGNPSTRNDSVMGGRITYSGVAPGANLITMKIGGGLGHNTNSGWPIASILDALNEVELLAKLPPQPVNQPIVAVSISASGYVSQDIDCHPDSDGAKIDAIAGRLKQLGIAVVMTAGNQASTTSTGAWTCGKNVIVVGATEVSMPTQPTDYTNISSKVALFAPVGQGNYPCDDRNCLMTTWKTQGSFVVWGTSFAAPQVAGAFAVLRHKYGQSPTVDQLLHLMQESGGLLSGPRATQANAQAKVLNIGNALKMSSYLID